MKSNLLFWNKKNAGFSLVEVMVAMVIGMLGLIIMMQVFSMAEGKRRSTTGTGDAQSNGAMALYSIQRDARQAGYGFNASNVIGCPINLPAPASHKLSYLAPVIINPATTDVPAGDDNTDTLLITYGSSEGSPEGDAIGAVNGSQLGVLTPANFRVNNMVVAAPGLPTNGCEVTMAKVTAVTAPNVTVPGSGATVDSAALFNFGMSPQVQAYAVRNGNLTVCNYMTHNCSTACTAGDLNCNSNWIQIATNIASLRAEYGHTTSTGTTWDQTTPVEPSPANQEAFACSWTQTSAVRIAIVARNSQVDKDQVSGPNAPTWAGSSTTAIDLSGRANWRNYRYKVFETVIPIRNLPWMASCT